MNRHRGGKENVYKLSHSCLRFALIKLLTSNIIIVINEHTITSLPLPTLNEHADEINLNSNNKVVCALANIFKFNRVKVLQMQRHSAFLHLTI